VRSVLRAKTSSTILASGSKMTSSIFGKKISLVHSRILGNGLKRTL